MLYSIAVYIFFSFHLFYPFTRRYKMQNTQLLEQIQGMLQENEIPLTFEQARQLLQVSKSTLYKLTFRRAIPFTKPGGGKLYFKRSDLIAWMNKNPVRTTEQIDEIATNHIMYK